MKLITGKIFRVDLSECRRKFFATVNSLFTKCKFTSDVVKLELLQSHCLPILLYSVDCLNLDTDQMKELNSGWNSVYRKIFNYNKWESVKEVIHLMCRLDLLHLINLRQIMFLKRLQLAKNITMSNIFYHYQRSRKFRNIYNVCHVDCNSSVGKVKALIYKSFSSLFAP